MAVRKVDILVSMRFPVLIVKKSWIFHEDVGFKYTLWDQFEIICDPTELLSA